MAKIVINGRFLGKQVTGVQRFAREIVAELDKIVKPGQFEIAIPPDVFAEIPLKNIKIVHIGKLKNRFWEHISFPLYALKKKKIPLNLCNVAPILKPGIATIHDVKVIAHPVFFSRKFVVWYKFLFLNIAKRSKIILTVSDFSKNEIVKHLGINSKKTKVIPNGWQHFEKIIADDCAIRKYKLKKKEYFFSISSLDLNKNFKWIVAVAQKNPNQIFAIAGGMNVKVFSNKFDFDVPENLKFLGYVTDEESKALMQNCKAFLFPSFYEGFGIPPLEALSVGSSVIVSDIPVMHEIFGNTVHYIDPHNANVDIENLLLEPVESAETVLEKYSWEKSADLLFKTLKDFV